MRKTSLTPGMALVLLLIMLIPLTRALAEEQEHEFITFDDPAAGSAQDALRTEEPHLADGQEKTVFGTDDRITVENPFDYPYSAIAMLVVKGECGETWTGTGFMIGEDMMMTAAHCLVCPEHGKWAEEITMYFGYRSAKNYALKYAGGWTARVGNTFTDLAYSRRGDYAFIQLKRDVGNQTGWFGKSFRYEDGEFPDPNYYVAGYREGELKYDVGPVAIWDEDLLQYNMDTLSGNSGCPVFTEDGYVIAINIASDDHYNYGYRLNRELHDEYIRFRDYLAGK